MISTTNIDRLYEHARILAGKNDNLDKDKIFPVQVTSKAIKSKISNDSKLTKS